ncbi:MAG TPA: hypothetical protein VMD48_09865 [Solirubrobacteraceae bacterium]|nr:hypothetical protein [Solirubrobacteraceae bacterium]
MRNSSLHDTLREFATDAGERLGQETEAGAEIPFEVISAPRRARSAPLYCYRPLTGAFIGERLGVLSALPSYAPAARVLTSMDGVDAYLSLRGETRIPGDPRERADATLRAFLSAVFQERSEFAFDPERFESAYAELERAVYEGRQVSEVIAPLLGIALDPNTGELPLGDGLSLIRGETLNDAPAEAVWGDGEEPNVLAMLTVSGDSVRPPVSIARSRFRRLLTALRLFERGGYALGPVAWTRSDAGPWRQVAFGGSGRPRLITFISAEQEDELRAFCNLIGRRMPSGSELAWALARFEMGCERLAPFEALTDYLLALRAMLEPEGPSSGRLAQRLSVICAAEPERAACAERTAHAISLERAVIAGLAPAEAGADAIVSELAENLRALLRDALCGHLDADVRSLADELLAQSV